MSGRFAAVILTIVSTAVCFCLSPCVTAYAASDRNSDPPSKGVTAVVVIGLFIAVSIVSAIITFKIRTKGSGSISDDEHKEE